MDRPKLFYLRAGCFCPVHASRSCQKEFVCVASEEIFGSFAVRSSRKIFLKDSAVRRCEAKRTSDILFIRPHPYNSGEFIPKIRPVGKLFYLSQHLRPDERAARRRLCYSHMLYSRRRAEAAGFPIVLPDACSRRSRAHLLSFRSVAAAFLNDAAGEAVRSGAEHLRHL